MINLVASGSEALIESSEENHDNDAPVISLRTAKLLKLRHNIRKLREEVFGPFSEAIKECNKTCKKASILIGELNDDITREGK